MLEIDQLQIRRGGITALLGPNGAGKTTLLALLAFLKTAEQGRICFDGREYSARELTQARRRIGLVPQKPYFLNGSVLDNIELGLKLRGYGVRQRRSRALDALQRVGASDFGTRQANELSGGESQRIALARALALEPEAILFDEPFTFLDQNSGREIDSLIRQLNLDCGTTVIFSTHDKFQGIALADRVIALVNGRIVNRPLVNFFSGRVADGYFDSGRIRIHVADAEDGASHMCIDPDEIVLSTGPLVSSMRNTLPGTIRAITGDPPHVRISVDAGERFEVLVTRSTLQEFGFTVGDSVRVNFKSTALKIFAANTVSGCRPSC